MECGKKDWPCYTKNVQASGSQKDHRSRGAMDAPSSCAEQAELARGVIGDLAAKWKIIS